MPFEIDVSMVVMFFLVVLLFAYSAALAALMMWIGKTDEPAAVAKTPERPSLRHAA